jgi:xanthine dehydrogenase accessory factor
MRDVLKDILFHLRAGTPLVLATVTRSHGSTPQKPGSTAVFSPAGLVAGTVGGGIVEHEVQHLASQALQTNNSGHYHFNLDASQDTEGAICGGETTILVDARPGLHLDAFVEMQEALFLRKHGALLTIIYLDGEEIDIKISWVNADRAGKITGSMDEKTSHEIMNTILSSPGPSFREVNAPVLPAGKQRLVFLEMAYPLPRLVIAGAGHIGKALAHLGKLLDFEVTVIDERSEYANKQWITDADHLVVEDIGPAMQESIPLKGSYIVIVTRGHRQDAEALKPCFGSGAAYIGMIGSAAKVATMKQKFISEGWATEEQWDQVHTPIGLAIGSKSVQEIAVSIAAQLVQVRNSKIKNYA